MNVSDYDDPNKILFNTIEDAGYLVMKNNIMKNNVSFTSLSS